MRFLYTLIFLVLGFSQSVFAAPEKIQNMRIVVYNTAPSSISRDFFRMIVYINGQKTANYLVSPGKDDPTRGYLRTPRGTYNPTIIKEMHYSSQSDSSIFYSGDPMPFSIFFYQGFALHGSYGTIDGQALSHGCVRLKYEDAKQLFKWVKEAIQNGGKKAVNIEIYDT